MVFPQDMETYFDSVEDYIAQAMEYTRQVAEPFISTVKAAADECIAYTRPLAEEAVVFTSSQIQKCQDFSYNTLLTIIETCPSLKQWLSSILTSRDEQIQLLYLGLITYGVFAALAGLLIARYLYVAVGRSANTRLSSNTSSTARDGGEISTAGFEVTEEDEQTTAGEESAEGEE